MTDAFEVWCLLEFHGNSGCEGYLHIVINIKRIVHGDIGCGEHRISMCLTLQHRAVCPSFDRLYAADAFAKFLEKPHASIDLRGV